MCVSREANSVGHHDPLLHRTAVAGTNSCADFKATPFLLFKQREDGGPQIGSGHLEYWRGRIPLVAT